MPRHEADPGQAARSRWKRGRARQLKEQGLELWQIAERLGVSTHQVGTWTAEAKNVRG